MNDVTPTWYWRHRFWLWLRVRVMRNDPFLYDFAVMDLNHFYRRAQREAK